MKFRRLGSLLGLFLVLTILTTGCSASTGVDKIGLYYDGGPIEGNKFNRIVDPGAGAQLLGWSDKIVSLPVSVRNYVVSLDPNEGDEQKADSIEAVTRDQIRVHWELTVNFKLNTRTDDVPGYKGGTLRRFYEQVCKRYHCDDDGEGWDQMLRYSFRRSLEVVLQQFTGQYNALDLRNNNELRSAIQKEIAAGLKTTVKKQLGGEYFCGPSFDWRNPDHCPNLEFILKAPQVPSGIAEQLERNKQSSQAVEQAQNEAKQKEARAQGELLARNAAQAAFSDPAYIEYLKAQAMQECARRGCTMVFGGAGVNVNTGR